MMGTYVEEGQELLAVGREEHKELIVSIHQDHIDDVGHGIGQKVRLRIGGLNSTQGQLLRIDPRASEILPHPALSALEGGPLAVTEATGQELEDSEVRLVEPRFKGVVRLSQDASLEFSCGQQGYVVLGWNQDGLGRHLLMRAANWLDAKLGARH
jgi:putative peptide zinc metalloprotease protein